MKKKKTTAVIIAVVVIVIIAAAIAVYFGIFYNRNTGETETDEIVESEVVNTANADSEYINPLTGESGFNADALSTRYVSVVVENSPAARPQYNMDSPDMIFEVEVEGGITRMLWLYADMTSLPSQVGPVRSARPSLLSISEWFDSIFIHYGGSHSTSDYTGAYELISTDNVDDIDGMTVSSCFKRTSDKSSPHNAALLGTKLNSAIKKKGYSTVKGTKVTTFSFFDSLTPVSDTTCTNATITMSAVSETHKFRYNENKGLYVNDSDYGKKITFTNVIALYAKTSYQKTSSYEYCLYDMSSGTGKLISGGASEDIKWKVDDGVLVLTDENGKEIELNKGKTWVGMISSNYGGSIKLS